MLYFDTKRNVSLWLSYQSALYSVVIILFQWRGINSLFVCLNGSFMMDNKGLQTQQCQKTHQKVKPFSSCKKKTIERL